MKNTKKKQESRKEEVSPSEQKIQKMKVQEGVLGKIYQWDQRLITDQELIKAIQEYLDNYMIERAQEGEPDEKESAIRNRVYLKIQRYIWYRIVSAWDPVKKESEQQIIKMVLMCDENLMANIFKRDIPTFKDKFIELAVLAGGEVKDKLRNFMRSERYSKILIERVTKTKTKNQVTTYQSQIKNGLNRMKGN